MEIHAKQLTVTCTFCSPDNIAAIGAIRKCQTVYRLSGYIFKELFGADHFLLSVINIYSGKVVVIIAIFLKPLIIVIQSFRAIHLNHAQKIVPQNIKTLVSYPCNKKRSR